ncbi:hypothetical protein TWF481_000554 [Arthrobotrys musiformis]|uniref:Uncharacterized protein n=1 Tax=Arthrobotrys musiformis TaxID=47236 RepID=A0AAV9WPH4_9PEZI
MPISIQRTFEDFCARMEFDIMENAARLDPMEDRITEMRRKIFVFFHAHLQELKDCRQAQNELGYVIRMTYSMRETELSALMEKRRRLLYAWSVGYWNDFQKLQLEFRGLSRRYNDKVALLEKHWNTIQKASENESSKFYSRLRDRGMFDTLQTSLVGMQKVNEQLAPAIQRFNELESVALKAKELVWKIYEIPNLMQKRKTKGGWKGMGWELLIRINQDWANELGMLNVNFVRHKNPGIDFTDIDSPEAETCKALRMINKVFGGLRGYEQGVRVKEADGQTKGIDTITENPTSIAGGKVFTEQHRRRSNNGSRPTVQAPLDMASDSSPDPTPRKVIDNSPLLRGSESGVDEDGAMSFSCSPIVGSSDCSSSIVFLADRMDVD